jgi:hypothetical protein
MPLGAHNVAPMSSHCRTHFFPTDPYSTAPHPHHHLELVLVLVLDFDRLQLKAVSDPGKPQSIKPTGSVPHVKEFEMSEMVRQVFGEDFIHNF